MTDPYYDEVLIVLNGPPGIEEPLVDWLLAREDSTGFTSFPVSGHSTCHVGLSSAEQVSGRQRRQQFQVQIRRDAVDTFLDNAGKSFGTAGIRYWVLPLSSCGHLKS